MDSKINPTPSDGQQPVASPSTILTSLTDQLATRRRAERDARIHATVGDTLARHGHAGAAELVASVEMEISDGDWSDSTRWMRITWRGDLDAIDALDPKDGRGYAEQIHAALRKVLPPDWSIEEQQVELRLLDHDPHWRANLKDRLRSNGINNQGTPRGSQIPRAPHVYEGLRYRSPAEVAIATALEATDAAYWPNCLGRLGTGMADRKTREADFLILHRGRLGVLEVDGDAFHTGRASQDHSRDRLFHMHGVRTVQRFTARECNESPADVVREFLKLLHTAGS